MGKLRKHVVVRVVSSLQQAKQEVCKEYFVCVCVRQVTCLLLSGGVFPSF